MLNILWILMIFIGVIYGVLSGNVENVSNAFIDYSKDTINLCITMAGIMSMWTGMMEIAEESGLIEGLTKKIRPFISFLFPKIPENHAARKYITINFIANFMGLGWAATPAGLRAMEELTNYNREKKSAKINVASNEMCTFLVMNISSLQLIPVNIIAYRSQYGSVNPAAIVAPAIAATLISSMVGVICCKLFSLRE